MSRQVRDLQHGAGLRFDKTASAAQLEFARAVAVGLSDAPRWIPSRFLYDRRGSELFERICTLPEYYLTRTEAGILSIEARTIAERTGPVTVVELGSGSSLKTDYLLDAYVSKGRHLRYIPVDVSETALAVAASRIERRFPGVRVSGVHGEYEKGFTLLRRLDPVMLLFLGSTLGNLNRTESILFWQRLHAALPAGGFVLLGVDLVKDPALLHAAYNDSRGVSAAFTLNVFRRVNRELGARIDLGGIEHVARYSVARSRVEIGARFLTTQGVDVRPIGRTFVITAGDHVRTEISRKFVLDRLTTHLECQGFRLVYAATDPRRWFAVLLLQKGDADDDNLRHSDPPDAHDAIP